MSNEGTERPDGPFDLPPPPRPAGWSTPPPAPTVRRLVRDPGASLGGVASGLSQHYGIDVSVIRLAFVLFTLISGVGLLLYILAWLIIPKGEVWPPAGAKNINNSLSSRELAIGAILIGLAMIVFVSGGSVGEVIVPLLLVGGGVWLLNQTQSANRAAPDQATVGSWPPPTATQPQDTVNQSGYSQDPMAQNAMGQVPPGVGSVPPGGYSNSAQPPKRRRPLRAIFIGGMALMGGFIAILFVGAAALLIFGDVNFETDASEQYSPQTVADIPESIQFDAGEIVLDLSALDSSDFEGENGPLNMDIELDAGEVRVVVPEDLAVEIDAAANLGDVDLFSENDDGIGPRLTWSDEDPDLRLDVNVGLGAVVIERP